MNTAFRPGYMLCCDDFQTSPGRVQWLLIEGIVGGMVPLREGLSVLDLIVNLGCTAVVVLRDKLGMVNDTMLTFGAM